MQTNNIISHGPSIVNETHCRYGVVPDSLMYDSRLSLQTRLVAAFLCSRSRNFKINIMWMCRQLGILDKRWRSIRDELEDLGMLVSKRLHMPNGSFTWTHKFCWSPANGIMLSPSEMQIEDEEAPFVDTLSGNLFSDEELTQCQFSEPTIRLFGTDAKQADKPVVSFTSSKQQLQATSPSALLATVRDEQQKNKTVIPTATPTAPALAADKPVHIHWSVTRKAVIAMCPTWLDADAWTAFVDLRRSKRKALTEYAAQIIIDSLSDFKAGGHNADKILKQTIASGWMNVYAPTAPRTNNVVDIDLQSVPEGLRTAFSAYPVGRRGQLALLVKVWEEKGLELHAEAIRVGIRAWSASPDWTKESGKFVPSLTRFLVEARWENRPKCNPDSYIYHGDDVDAGRQPVKMVAGEYSSTRVEF